MAEEPLSDPRPNDDPPEPGDDPDDDLSAHFDGELGDDDTQAVDARLAHDPHAREKIDAFKRIDGLLGHLPKPEPSPDFTTRTLTRLQPVAGSGSRPSAPVSVAPAAGFSGSASAVAGFPPPRPTVGWWGLLAWLSAALVAGVGGYVAHAALRPVGTPTGEELSFSDLRVIENLPLYLGVDDLAFVRALDETAFFEVRPTSSPSAAPADAPRVEMTAGVREKLIALFKSYPAARQQQLRQLDQSLHELPAPERERVANILRQYSVWLDRLADSDRKDVLSAPTAAERLDAVRRVWEKGWRESLPQRQREKLQQVADTEERLRLVEEWKKEERDRRDEWQLARTQWRNLIQEPGRTPWPFSDPTLSAEVDEYVRKVLKADLGKSDKPDPSQYGRLSREEYLELRARHDAAKRDRHVFSYASYGRWLYQLDLRHPYSPEPGDGRPVTEVQHLPRAFREVKPRSLLLGIEKRAPRGKWPEFAREVVEVLGRGNVLPSAPLGPARPGEFTKAVNTFLSKTLMDKLTPKEKGELRKLEGKWPAYPDKMMDLANKYDLPVPGVTLPGKPSEWERHYSLRPVRRK